MTASAFWLVGWGDSWSIPSLPAILSLPREVLIGIAAVAVLAVFCFWLLVRAGRRRYVTLRQSDTTDMIAYQLGRIADALERLSVQREPPPASTGKSTSEVYMSMFGR